MNKIIIFVSLLVLAVLINGGVSSRTQMEKIKNDILKLQVNIQEMKQKVRIKKSLPFRSPVFLSTAYIVLLNQIRYWESDGSLSMNVQLDGGTDAQDISSHFERTEYKGIKGLKIKIVVDRLSQAVDMGEVLDDIDLLERKADFKVLEINKASDNLTIKGEVYGL